MKTLLAKGNIPESDVTFFSVRYDFTPFFNDKTDLWPVYRNSQGPILMKKLEAAGEAAVRETLEEFAERGVSEDDLQKFKAGYESGRVFGLMPHPEAFNHYSNHPSWP